ncbi:MAG TPA: hypothetical protein VGI81_04590 [Tepidisphaeraceae bacterium]|jgi:hypothetical protein
MRTELTETEEQRRLRVASRIRNSLLPHVAEALVELARKRKLPDQWMTAGRINQHLDKQAYWADHPDVMASFLSIDACEETVEKALDWLTTTHPDVWVRVGRQYKPAGRYWCTYAAQKANRIRREYPSEERTAFFTGSDGASILFAHDDYETDPRAQQTVALVRRYLAENGIPELGFGLSADRKTWVMVVWSQDDKSLSKALFDAWQTAFSEAESIAF